MSNSIWHKYDIKDMPDENNLVVLVDKDDGFYNACFVDKIDWVNDWYDHIEKWAYLSDVLAQADKAERLQKAVDKAIWILEESKKVQRPDFKIGFTYCLFPQPHLDIILDEIKQLIKGE